MKQYDVVVVGLGIMGAAAAWRASALGASVLAIEQGGPTHRLGSSHGATRIFRQAYWEGASFLPALAAADKGWRYLEKVSGTPLLVPTGGLFIGPQSTGVVRGSLNTALGGGIEHAHLSAEKIRQHYPQFTVDDDMEAVVEPGAYTILAEEARLQMLNEAVRCGATLLYGETIESISSSDGRPLISTRVGRSVVAGCVLLCGGANSAHLVPELQTLLQPNRVPIFWFDAKKGCEAAFGRESMPVFLYEAKDGALLYGIASGVSAERGVKIGFHNRQHVPLAHASATAPDIGLYVREIEAYVADIFPNLIPSAIGAKWCIYTMTPDESFVLDRATVHPNVFYASACSGHGFKFAPAIGQLLAEQGLGFEMSVDIGQFARGRFVRASEL